MSIIKAIDFDGYNRAECLSIYQNGDVLCNIWLEDEGGNILKWDRNISFPADNLPFELSDEEIEELMGVDDDVQDQ